MQFTSPDSQDGAHWKVSRAWLAYATAMGLTSNDVGWSSGYVAWGGYMKIKPARWYYAQAGIFLAIPNANNTANHGLGFQGARPADRNGFYVISETGVTPQIGRLQLLGKYIFGGYYWGLENTSFFGQPFDGKLGFTGKRTRCSGASPRPKLWTGNGKTQRLSQRWSF
jgi:carbohydrate-selective porin OprB